MLCRVHWIVHCRKNCLRSKLRNRCRAFLLSFPSTTQFRHGKDIVNGNFRLVEILKEHKIVWKRYNLRSNFRLVETASSSPISDHQKAQRAVVFGGLIELLKLCTCKCSSQSDENEKEKVQRHAYLVRYCHGLLFSGLKKENRKQKNRRQTLGPKTRIGCYSNTYDLQVKKKNGVRGFEGK